MTSERDRSLLAAYLATLWAGTLPTGKVFEFRLDRPLAGVDLLSRLGAGSAAIVTAWNPRSEPLSLDENRRRNRSLVAELAAEGLEAILCTGRSTLPGDDWAEESLLVPDCPRKVAVLAGVRWDQNAVVWWDCVKLPVLVVTREGFLGRPVGAEVGIE